MTLADYYNLNPDIFLFVCYVIILIWIMVYYNKR